MRSPRNSGMKLLTEMRQLSIQPNVTTYNSAISADEKSKKQWHEAAD